MAATSLWLSRCAHPTRRSRVLSTSSQTFGDAKRTSVVIVGGGPTGLLLSNLLSLYGTPSVLLESQTPDQRFAHPQAHFLNTRTMEILRHALPNVYKEVWNKVPPVSNWNHFQWGSSMTNSMARVRHPVDFPLKANMDGNGKLLPDTRRGDENYVMTEAETDDCQNLPLSICSVAHLAQHHFCRILWQSAEQNAGDGTLVEYGATVASVEQNDEDPEFPISVTTAHGENIRTKFVVAADGANSTLRRKVWKIGLQGQKHIQSLVNVHIRTSASLSNKLHSGDRSAMLHFIYHRSIVAVVVCHDVGEYVLQIPFFPPYQTLEEDFSEEKVRNMVECALGVPQETTTNKDLEIVSIRPWTMSSLIADKYVFGDRCVLAGDSAHVFPPAGGLGMNTGLQDVYNLAWRLSWLHDNSAGNETKQQEITGPTLRQYEQERRSVAQQNAALSVRNYNRTLKLAKACYLNDQHPQALMSLLSSPPFSFLPLTARQETFRTLVKTAMLPLRALQSDNSIHGKRIKQNVLGFLQTGSGLPLLFPMYELGFRYAKDVDTSEPLQNVGGGSDTAGYSPRVRVGFLFPHAVMRVMSPRPSVVKSLYPHLVQIDNSGRPGDEFYVTTTDMSAQLREGPTVTESQLAPSFVLFLVDCDAAAAKDISRCISPLGVPLQMVNVVSDASASEEPPQQSNFLTLVDSKSALRPMLRPLGTKPKAVLVRPDGHVASICVIEDVADGEKDDDMSEETGARLCSLADLSTHLTRGIRQSFGTSV